MGAYWTIKRDEDVEDIKTVKPFEESKVKSNMRQYPPKVDFDGMEETVIPHFKGGEKEFAAKMFVDELNKIMRGRLIPGASIGMHTHDSGSEILMVTKGKGSVIIDGEKYPLKEGDVHYCPKGHSHSLLNDSREDLEFFAVVPEQ